MTLHPILPSLQDTLPSPPPPTPLLPAAPHLGLLFLEF